MRALLSILPAVLVVAIVLALLDAAGSQQAAEHRCDIECVGLGFEGGGHTAEGCECAAPVASVNDATAAAPGGAGERTPSLTDRGVQLR